MALVVKLLAGWREIRNCTGRQKRTLLCTSSCVLARASVSPPLQVCIVMLGMSLQARLAHRLMSFFKKTYCWSWFSTPIASKRGLSPTAVSLVPFVSKLDSTWIAWWFILAPWAMSAPTWRVVCDNVQVCCWYWSSWGATSMRRNQQMVINMPFR